MRRFVLDASVAVKWFLPEADSEAAQQLLSRDYTLLAPDLIFSEVGNILWKRVLRGELTPEEAEIVLQTFGGIPIEIHDSWPLMLLALEIACQTRRTVYDSLYLALAWHQSAVFVTADAKLVNSLQSSPLASLICLVTEVK